MPRHSADSDGSASQNSSALFVARERTADRRRFIIAGSGIVLGSWAAPNLQSFAAASTIANSGNGQLAAFALGQPVTRSVAVAAVGSDQNLDALIATGAAEVTDSGLVELDFEVLSDGRSMAILPFLDDPAGPSTDSVYAGSDSCLLVDRVWPVLGLVESTHWTLAAVVGVRRASNSIGDIMPSAE